MLVKARLNKISRYFIFVAHL